MLTERQIDFNINLWDVCSSGNPSDNSPCAIAIATRRPQWFAVQFIQATLIELSTRTLPRDARTLAHPRAQDRRRQMSVGKLREARARQDDGGARIAGNSGSRKRGNSSRRDFRSSYFFSDSYTTSWSHPIKRTRKHTQARPRCDSNGRPSPGWCAERAWQGSRLASVLTSIAPRARGRQSRVLSWARLLNKLIKEQTLFQTNQKITRQL